ncbi:MAG: hypothetical protein H6733_06570 [Alphaproteobacteria bacterium]|nr:hypothetical protein [Alphaproteobacteria bacterium]
MGRWIVAGVLVLVLVGIIVGDEFGMWTSDPVAMEPVMVGASDSDTDTDGIVQVPGSVLEPEPEHTPPEIVAANKACEALVSGLVATKGDAWADKVGEALYGSGMTADEVGSLCGELQTLDEDQVVARLSKLTGVTE